MEPQENNSGSQPNIMKQSGPMAMLKLIVYGVLSIFFFAFAYTMYDFNKAGIAGGFSTTHLWLMIWVAVTASLFFGKKIIKETVVGIVYAVLSWNLLWIVIFVTYITIKVVTGTLNQTNQAELLLGLSLGGSAVIWIIISALWIGLTTYIIKRWSTFNKKVLMLVFVIAFAAYLSPNILTYFK
jgi:hypothetical protein